MFLSANRPPLRRNMRWLPAPRDNKRPRTATRDNTTADGAPTVRTIRTDQGRFTMRARLGFEATGIAAAVAVIMLALAMFGGMSVSAQDKYSVQVPNGLAFAEFRGFEDWQTVAVSHAEDLIEVILANPVMIAAYRAGVPGNGQPFPDGSKM